MKSISNHPARAALLAALFLYFGPFLAWAAQVGYIEGSKVLRSGFLSIRDGYLRVGSSATPDVTLGQGDLFVEGTAEINGATRLDNDLTIAASSTGGNAGARNSIAGLPQLKLVSLGTMTNGSTETTSYTDDSSAGEYAPIDANTVTEAEGSTDSIYRIGSSSYKASFSAAAVAGDGFKRSITSDSLASNESIGFWLYSTAALASGDLQILLTDDGGARNFAVAVAVPASAWTWIEVAIDGLDGTTGDAVTEFGITLTSQGAAAQGAFAVYLDGAWKWDATDEEALGVNIVQDGVLSVAKVATAAGSANTPSDLTENTDFFVHYESGVDFSVTITDQSAGSGVALVAYQ